ncbi:MAG TPA: hypothetical protein VFO29_01535 [Candidatus Rubrimentiphilum sp.]|nr:hypothetical protein [Candidatus Rubrimentiphilum sp.]
MKQRCDPQMLAPLMDRVKDLLERRFDPAYRNPSDAALAAYLAILDCAGKDYSLPIIDQYAARRDLWWARRLASHLQPFAFSQKYVAESSAAKLGGEVPLRAFLVTDAGKVLSRGKTFPVNPRGEWIAKGPIFLDFALNHHGVKLQRANVPEFFVYGHLERKVS